MKAHTMTDDVIFWKWISENMIAMYVDFWTVNLILMPFLTVPYLPPQGDRNLGVPLEHGGRLHARQDL